MHKAPYRWSGKTLKHRAESIANSVKRFWERIDKRTDSECWNWLGGTFASGYGVARLNNKAESAHRLAWKLSHGDIPDGLFVCHACDNKRCCNPSHLFVGTSRENTHDAMRKGLLPKGPKNFMTGRCGERHPNAKLHDNQVREILERCKNGEPQHLVGKSFGISQAHVWSIVHGVIWSHIKVGSEYAESYE